MSFLVKDNHMQATAILDTVTGKVTVNTKNIISDNNAGLKITHIVWFNKVGTGKLY